jgi:hypothetical protein
VIGNDVILCLCNTMAWTEGENVRYTWAVCLAFCCVVEYKVLGETIYGSTGRRVSLMYIRDSDENGFHRPVLKHGPRSLTYMQVFGFCQSPECVMKVKASLEFAEVGNGCKKLHGTIDRSSLVIDLSKSISVETRKMVIYA